MAASTRGTCSPKPTATPPPSCAAAAVSQAWTYGSWTLPSPRTGGSATPFVIVHGVEVACRYGVECLHELPAQFGRGDPRIHTA
ncbi:hypothetical protein [Streptomyces sp. NPDC093984]|uniref:hypothetical protein n=1 Tax=Streptomyces sp. NPDC093984 TaxID=3366052 RepID=UPI00380056BE